MSKKNEIILYQAEDSTQVEVKVADETVWLTQAQIVTLFDSSKANISEHIKHIFQTGELEEISVVRKFRTTASDGKKYNVSHYSLDVIISVGYRVNSIRGTQFRIWATKVLKDHLLKGYSINNRMNRMEDNMDVLSKKVNEIDLQLNTNLLPKQGVFYDGQVFDAYVFAADLIKSANKSIVLIDNYIDESVLQLFTKRKSNVHVTIFTKRITKILEQDLEKHNTQYPKVEIKKFSKAHDRFLIIDGKHLYHLGASLKDLGKKWFAFSKMELDVNDILNKLDDDKR